MSKWQSERSIHEMLKDTPPIRESSDSITSGTEAKFPTSRSMPFPPTYATECQNGSGGGDVAGGSSTLVRASGSKLESIRSWGVSTYRCTKQILYEKLGKSSRTVDTELEAHIEVVRETQRKYLGVVRLSAALASQLGAALATQRALGEAFADLAQKSPELRDQFLYNADTQRSLARNGEALLAALHFFNNSLSTLTNKTIEDTLLTVRQYEAARVEYDAYRSEVEAGGSAAGVGQTASGAESLQGAVQRLHARYSRLRSDAAVKMQLLHQNRIKVMNKQLLLFHNAVSAYFSGNHAALQAAVRHLHVAPLPPPVQASASPPVQASASPPVQSSASPPTQASAPVSPSAASS